MLLFLLPIRFFLTLSLPFSLLIRFVTFDLVLCTPFCVEFATFYSIILNIAKNIVHDSSHTTWVYKNPCARSIGRESKSFARTKQLQTTRRILNCFRGRVFTSLFIVVVGRLVGRSSSLDFFSSASHKTFWLGVCYNIPFMHSFYHHFHFMFVFNLCLNKWECFCWFRNGRLCVWVAFLLFLNFFFVFFLSSFSFLTIWFRLSPFVWFAFDFGFSTDLHATFALVYNIMKWMAFLSTM